METALVLAANGIKAYLFDRLRPTPELSFAVRYRKAAAGVIITASHNPKEYNGFKVYWQDGGQIAPEKADEIVAAIKKRDAWVILPLSEKEARERGLLCFIGEEVDRAYLQAVKEQFINASLIRERGDQVKIVYTPLHGSGGELVMRIMAELGFSNTMIVEEQAKPDGEFPTVVVPNPEEDAAFALALKKAQETGADLVAASDPDADRVGIYCKKEDGAYRRLNGNEVGVLMAYYLLSLRKRNDMLPQDGRIIKSVVSTALAEKIAADFGVELVAVPVGFKFIGEKIKEMEISGKGSFLWGFEESLGYLTGTYARDKDAVLATALIAEAALYYKLVAGKTLAAVMEELYHKYGYYLDDQVALTLRGKDGRERIAALMTQLRQETRPEIAGIRVAEMTDYRTGITVTAGKKSALVFPKVDILRFTLADGGFIMARPSGTEPKIRFYFCIAGENEEAARKNLEQVKKDFFSPYQSLIR